MQPTFSTLFAGLDYTTGQLPVIITVRPEDQSISIPVTVLADTIPEVTEQFRLTLSIPPATAQYALGPHSSTTVHIVDDDGKTTIMMSWGEKD